MKLFDSHAHLDHEGFPNEVEDVITRAKQAGVAWITTIGSSGDVSLMKEAVAVAEGHENVFAAVGIHPHEAKDAVADTFEQLGNLLDIPKVVALGECGLDYHYMHSPRQDQLRVFQQQIEMAYQKRMPLVLHCRKAHDDCIRMLQTGPLNTTPGIVHCFDGTKQQMVEYLDLGFYVSIPGIVTFKKADYLREAVKDLPMDRMLIETDSPYLAPKPFRGKRNEPSYVVYTAMEIARIKGCDVETVAMETAKNAKQVYGIKDE